MPQDAETIQAGLNVLDVGDTVLVSSGTYAEALTAPRLMFTLMGDVGPDSIPSLRPIVDLAQVPGSDTLYCMLQQTESRCTIEDMVFRHGQMGIRSRTDRVTLKRCLLDSSRWGFYHTLVGLDSAEFRFSDCTFQDHSMIGVHVIDYPVIAFNCYFPSGTGSSLCNVGPGSRISNCRFGANPNGNSLVIVGNNIVVTFCEFGPTTTPSVFLLRLAQTRANVVVRQNTFSNNIASVAVLKAMASDTNAFLIEQNLLVANRVVTDSGTGGMWVNPDRPDYHEHWGGVIRENHFVNCFGRGGAANSLLIDQDVTLQNNQFIESEFDALELPVVRVRLGDHVVGLGNRFVGTDYALAAEASLVRADSNFWGHSSGPYHETLNPTGLGDTITGNVDFDPWLTDTTNSTGDARNFTPKEYSLSVFPNPFNSVTRITFSAPTGDYRIELFNALGQYVQEVWSGEVSGMQDVSFNGTELSTGVYFVRALEVNGRKTRALEKIVLLK